MLLHHLGRDQALAGYQAFLRKYHHTPDHPVLQDFVATMRDFAADRRPTTPSRSSGSSSGRAEYELTEQRAHEARRRLVAA
jgi:hypothetical protein